MSLNSGWNNTPSWRHQANVAKSICRVASTTNNDATLILELEDIRRASQNLEQTETTRYAGGCRFIDCIFEMMAVYNSPLYSMINSDGAWGGGFHSMLLGS